MNKQATSKEPISVKTLTASCLTIHKENKRIKYFQALELSQPINEHFHVKRNVLIGDLVVYSTPDGHAAAKCSGKVKIGQVLALLEEKDQASSLASYKAIVRPFYCFNQVKHQRKQQQQVSQNSLLPMLSEQDDTNIRKNVRYQQALFETIQTESFALNQVILNRTIQLVQSTATGVHSAVQPERLELLVYSNSSGMLMNMTSKKQKLPKTPLVDNAWLLKYVCANQIDANGNLTQTLDWTNYTGWSNNANISRPFQRGLDCLNDQTLVRASLEQVDKLLQPFLSRDRCFVALLHDEHDSEAEAETQPARPADRKRKARLGHAETSEVDDDDNDTECLIGDDASGGESAIRVSRKRKGARSKKAAPSKKPKKAKTAATKRSKVVETRESDIETNTADCSSAQRSTVQVTPLVDSCYTLLARAQGKNNSSKKKSLHFYTHLQLSIDKFALDTSIRRKAAKDWVVSVGDVICVSCAEAADTKLSGKPLHATNQWFPFTVPWSAAQVLSIYRIDGDDSNQDGTIPFFMELRWFYRPSELDSDIIDNLTPDIHKDLFGNTVEAARMMIEVDEHVTEASVESALGMVITTGKRKNNAKWKEFLSSDNVPQIHLLIQYAYLMQFDEKTVRPTSDWITFGDFMDGPLNVVLKCEKGWPGRKESKRLRKLYKTFIMKKYNLHGENIKARNLKDTSLADEVDERSRTKQFTCWSKELLNDSELSMSTESATVLHSADIGHGKQRQFLHSIFLPVVRKRCDPRATASKAAAEQYWNLKIGNFVCMIDEDAICEPDAATSRNPWFPFLGPWNVCQVLCIYSDKSRRGAASVPMLEVRRFLRRNNLPSHIQSWMPPRTDLEREFCFETNSVEVGVLASRVLGRAELFLGQHNDSAAGYAEDHAQVPSRACRCAFFYDEPRARFQPLFCASKTPAGWLSMMHKRGFSASSLIQSDAVLMQQIMIKLESEKKCSFDEMLVSDHKNGPASVAAPLELAFDTPHFISLPLHPEWPAYVAAEQYCSQEDRDGLVWFAHIGDVVAVRTLGDDLQQPDYPFTVPWKAGQVLSISLTQESIYMVEFLWLERRCAGVDEESLDCLAPSEAMMTCEVPATDILAPITIFGDTSVCNQWNSVYPFLPVVPVRYELVDASSRTPTNQALMALLARGLALSSHYNQEKALAIISLLEDIKQKQNDFLQAMPTTFGSPLRFKSTVSDCSVVSPATEVTSVVHVNSPAFHADKSSSIQFFKTINVTVPAEALPFHEGNVRNTPWRINVGDVVVLQFSTGGRRVKMVHCEPFSVPWGVAEIVTMFTRPNANNERNDVLLEIRWFYRLEDIPGSERRKVEECESILDEVFESDHYDEVPSKSLLAPAKLIYQDDQVDDLIATETRFVFICRSFWSQKNKSIVPAGGLKGRIDRGQRFSKFYSQLGSLSNNAHAKVPAPASDMGSQFITSAFQRVIEKLSLTDASKEATDDGDGLVGREKERNAIKSFLRLAIIGRINDKRPSIFIAGPPGVGKTACVRAVINDLQREQVAGELPAFHFITMNGMEMRHPLEFYARFLELLTGDRGGLAAKAASQRLDNYFGKSEGGDSSTTVLLVDEIDYLVTKDQSVIYSLFDWPARSAEIACPRRLVLIGISNTLNLPEQMHPRVQSRLGAHRCPFRAYGIPEAANILRTKITRASPHYDVFKQDCIDFAAKKTATMSGDIRKALTICRTAAESVLDEIESGKNTQEKPQVVLKHLFSVTASAFNSPQAHRIHALADFEILVVVALASLSKSTGREQGGFDVEEVMTKMQAMANGMGDVRYTPSLSLMETLQVLSQLGAAQLVSLQTPRNVSVSYRAAMAGSGGAWPLVALLVDANALWLTLKNGPHEALVKKYLKR
ncbi:hypothetical protein MPSEU_000001400 [Mayamaea pseudoterrestris]|nr:hypothetical protein MPSEU_000001400 [Mayamaea pseudoterrestris]